MRQQREQPGAGPGPARVGEQDLDQAVVDRDPRLAGGFGDGAPQVGIAHRTDDDLRLLGGTGELGVLQCAAVEVGAQGDRHGHVERAQCVDELRALGLVDGRAEDLLELVDHQQRGTGANLGQGGERALAGCEQRRRGTVDGQGGHHPGAQEGRLARTRGADHHQRAPPRRLAERRHDRVDQRRPPEQPRRVLGPEALEPAVGRGRGARPASPGHLAHPAEGLVPLLDGVAVVDPARPQDRVERVRVRAVPTGEPATERAGDDAGRLVHLPHGQPRALPGKGQLAGELRGVGRPRRVGQEPLRGIGLVGHVHPPPPAPPVG